MPVHMIGELNVVLIIKFGHYIDEMSLKNQHLNGRSLQRE